MGASQLGQDCGRAVWYSFHWATKAAHSGRMLRLFNRGHIEEARFIAMLLTVGMPVYQPRVWEEQFRIHFGRLGTAADLGSALHIIIMPQLWIELRLHNGDPLSD